MFALLLSSHFIFNCKSVIDSEMIQQLGLVTRMTEKIRLSNNYQHQRPEEVEPDEYKQLFPALTVLVRDFELQLKDEEGSSISPDDYFKNAIAKKKGNAPALISTN